MELIQVRFNEEKNQMEELRYIMSFERYNNVLSQIPELEHNDFELQVKVADWKKHNILLGDWIYIANSEWGGEVEGIEHIDNIVKLTGSNFRGRLERHAITPKPLEDENRDWTGKFADYLKIANKDANSYLHYLYQLNYSKWGQYVDTDPYTTINLKEIGVKITDEIRFANFLEQATDVLRKNNLRLEAKHGYFQYTEPRLIYEIQSKVVTDYSNDTFIDVDTNINISSKINKIRSKKYCLCLWKGELEERETVLLSISETGSVAEVEPFWEASDFLSSTIIYDNPNAETKEELKEFAKKRIQESHIAIEQIEFSVKDDSVEYFLGDLIGGADEITGISGIKEIVEKELTIDSNGGRISYKVE